MQCPTASDRSGRRARALPMLRIGLACGMLLALLAGVLDTVFLPRELLTTTVVLRITTVFCALAVAFAATYVQAVQQWIDTIVTASLLVAGVGVSTIAVAAAGAGKPLLLFEPMLIALAVYLLSGLPLRHCAIAALPTLLTVAGIGYGSGLPLETLVYAFLFLALANLLGFICCRRQQIDGQHLASASQQLAGLINTDRLTGIYNRQAFDDHLARVWRQSRRERHNLSLLIIDIDHMQEFNKRYGHPEGDRCIQRVGEALKKSVRRPLDFVARYDGSRFALVLYDPPTAYIRRLVVNIQTAIAELHIPNEGSPIGPRITVSIGAVVLGPQTSKSLEAGLQFAEEALSASKLRGRDRAVVFQSSDLERAADTSPAATPASA
jgi:diguanylate cyclase (GGDEF)-like protein